MKGLRIALVLIGSLAGGACSISATTSTTSGVDGAPDLIKSTFLTVSGSAATLAGYEATGEEWMEFAREVCNAGIGNSEDLADFVADWAGPNAEPAVTQMWSTAAGAATGAFCPMH